MQWKQSSRAAMPTMKNVTKMEVVTEMAMPSSTYPGSGWWFLTVCLKEVYETAFLCQIVVKSLGSFFLAMPPYSFAWQGADCWILMFPAWVDVWYFTGLRQTTGRTMGTSTLLVQMHSNFSWKNCWMPITSTFVHWVAKKFPVFSDSWLSNEVDVLKEDFSWGRQHRLKAKSRPKQSESWPILKRGASSCWAFFWFVALAQRFGQIFFSAIARVISPASYECIPPISQEEVTTHWWFKWIGWGCSLLIG